MPKARSDIIIRQLREEDVKEARRILRLAFGTFMHVPDPTKTFGDRDSLTNRWRADRRRVLAAYLEGRKLVGSNVVSRWGTFGWFGPLTVTPEMWDRGIAKKLLEKTMEMLSEWRTTHQGLFTFAASPKHMGLYEGFGFNARFLTPVMKKRLLDDRVPTEGRAETFSSLKSGKEKGRALDELREITGHIYDGLDLSEEITAVASLGLGDTIVVRDGSRIAGFAVCHHGADTEGGSGNCYVKFGAAPPGPSSEAGFGRLLSAVESYARRKRLATVEAGVNMARRRAYKLMRKHGFRSELQGVAMQKPDEPGFNRADVFAIDDWR